MESMKKNEIQTRPHQVPSMRKMVRMDQSDKGGGKDDRYNLFMLWASSAPHRAQRQSWGTQSDNFGKFV